MSEMEISENEIIPKQSAEQTLEEQALVEQREITILQALDRKGPALPIELAVRTYSFPEEIAGPLTNLEEKGWVERQAMKTGEMIVLTKAGHEQVKGA